MKVGTKSVLFGYHAFWVHPFIVWAAWVRLYGWTWDPRVILSFFLHDIGYVGKPNMDGVAGKEHPFIGAWIMHVLFDGPRSAKWFQFTLFHSRDIANMYFGKLSRLGYADKLAFNMYPRWLIAALYRWSGEAEEYFAIHGSRTLDDFLAMGRAYNQKTLEEAKRCTM